MERGGGIGFRLICWWVRTGCPKRCGCRNRNRAWVVSVDTSLEARERRGEETMNRNIWACSLVGRALLLGAGMLSAQDPLPPAAFEFHREGPDGGGPGVPFGERIELLGFEGLH